MTLTPQEQEAMAVSDRAKPYVEASRGQTIDPPSSEEIALVDLAALVRRLLEREKVLTEALGPIKKQMPSEPGKFLGFLIELKGEELVRLATAISALNPGEKKP
jgi:hypothetical protein